MLTAKNVSFEYNQELILQNTSLSINAGDRIGLIGPNGVGKSTLLKIFAGILKPSNGKLVIPEDLNIGYLPQEIQEYSDLSCEGFIEKVTGTALALANLDKAMLEYSKELSDDSQKAYELAFATVESLGAYTLGTRTAKALATVGLSDDILSKKVGELSGGQKTKLALASILLAQFDVYLLDEPTNNLDLDGIQVLERFVKNSNATFVITSHDRRFLRTCITKIAEILPDKSVQIYTLGYDEYIEARRKEKEAQLQRQSEFQDERKRLTESARDKLYSANAAASSKSSSDNEKVGRNARKEKAVRSHARAAASIQSRLEQMTEPGRPTDDIDLNFRFNSESKKISEQVIKLVDATVTYDSIVLGPYTLNVQNGQKIIVIGPNGGGKSTLLKLMAGEIKPHTGKVEKGSGVTIGHVDQDYRFPDQDSSIIANVQKMTGEDIPTLYNLLARFNIKKLIADSLPGTVSPGQRSRALLACLVAKGTNVLLLDEPTNHLDIVASDELQDAINEYEGAVVIITHDRELIDTLEPKVILVVSDGRILSDKDAEPYILKTLQ